MTKFIIAVIFLFLGNILRELRWEMFIEVYEKPQKNILLKSLSMGSFLNFFLPLKLGDIFRGIYSGKKMKNGMSCSFATIVVDRYIDIVSVGIIFIVLYLTKIEPYTEISSIILYVSLGISLLLLAIVCIKYNKFPKIIIQKIASLFNSKIELKMLTFSYFFISAFRDVYKKLNKLKLINITIFMWVFYLISYYMFGLFINTFSEGLSTFTIFNFLFSNGNLGASTLSLSANILIDNFPIYLCLYIIIPVITMYFIGFMIKSPKLDDNKFSKILPHSNENDRLNFLELYFSGLNRDYFKNYSMINSNISIIQDYSAGSNATTMLCKNENGTFYRKYVFGDSSNKLFEQIKWINEHKKDLPLPKIIKKGYEKDNYCYYDMEYKADGVVFFNYIHSVNPNRSFKLLIQSLNCLEKKLYSKHNIQPKKETIYEYIDSKVIKNLNKIRNANVFKEIINYDYIIINGKKYKNLKLISKLFNRENLYNIFKNDKYCDIHGDLTIENLVRCDSNTKKDGYYFIDPNTGNIHNSDNLDYGKILQSLHGKYEFLMHTQDIRFYKNNLDYYDTTSYQYKELFQLFDKYITEHFSYEKTRSIYYHEIVHWLRLLPYKIEKNGERALLFYAGLIIVSNDVYERFGDVNEI